MGRTPLDRRAFRLFARLLEYPGADLPLRVRECLDTLPPDSTEAAGRLRDFLSALDRTTPGRWEELYTAAFDLQMVCSPYVGHHILGDNSQRSAFMVGLKERYGAHGFVVENELPDHLAVMLRFLAESPGRDLSRELIGGSMIPALEMMLPLFGDGVNPYGEVVGALLAALHGRTSAGKGPSQAVREGGDVRR